MVAVDECRLLSQSLSMELVIPMASSHAYCTVRIECHSSRPWTPGKGLITPQQSRLYKTLGKEEQQVACLEEEATD